MNLQLSEMDIVHQIERLHAYPPHFYRVGHILESRPESILFYRTQEAFYNQMDLAKLSPNPIYLLIIPFLLWLFFKLVQKVIHDR